MEEQQDRGISAAPTGLSPSVEPHSRLAGFAASIPDACLPREFWYLRDRCEFPLAWRLYAAWKMLVAPNTMAAALVLHAHAKAQAMSAREGQDRNGLGAKPASAVGGNADAPKL